MKKKLAVFLSLVMLMSLAGCSGSSSTETAAQAESTAAAQEAGEVSKSEGISGTFTGTSAGRNGDVVVDVTLDDGKIADIEIVSSKETQNIGSVAVTQIAQRVVDAQSISVDTLSGATLSSAATLSAIRDALKNAGADVADYEIPIEVQTGQDIEVSGDVIVVGGGGAGLAAAVSALQSGAQSVVIIEKTDILGGDTNVNGGIYNAPDKDMQSAVDMTEGNRMLVEEALAEEAVSDAHAELMQQVQADYDEYNESDETGIFDSAAWYALQTWNGGDKLANLDLVTTLADNSFAGYQWLENLGVTFKSEISQGPGSLYPRTHDTETGLGAEFVNGYIEYMEENYPDNYTIYYGVTADTLLLNDDGVCIGVSGTDKNDNTYTFNADNGIVLATGGFAGNVEMRVEYCQGEKWPNLGTDVKCTGVASDTGDGIIMAEEIGAGLVDMDQIQLLHTCNPKNGTTDDNSIKDKSVTSVIFVNQDGNRFVAEDDRRDTICLAVLEQDEPIFYAIESWDGYGDATLDELLTNNGVPYSEEIEIGNMYIADTLEELAEEFGAVPENLVNAVESYNAVVDSGESIDEFGRTTFVEKLENGPFIAVPRAPAAHHTMGGVEINSETEVIDTNGEVIPGLYAAGEVTGGIHGTNRLGGNAIVDTVVMGKIAGENAAGFTR